MKKTILLTLIIYALFGLSSCKEKCDDPEPVIITEKSNKRLSSFRYSSDNFENQIHIAYLPDGRITKCDGDMQNFTFSYQSGKIIKINSNEGWYEIHYPTLDDSLPDYIRTPGGLKTSLTYKNGKIINIISEPINQPNSKYGSYHNIAYNEDGSLKSLISYVTNYNGGIIINDTIASIENDGGENLFIKDKALHLWTIINGELYNLGAQNVVKLTMSDGRVINRTPKIDDVGRYIGCTKSGDGVIETDLDLYYN